MKKFREPDDRRQQSLLPRSLEEFVPRDDLARTLITFGSSPIISTI